LEIYIGGISVIPVCRFHNPRAACIALGKVARKKIGDASLRQFNRFESKETDWWLAPTKERPTFKYGKFLFDWCGDDCLLFGLYVEKGVDPSLKQFFTSKRGRDYLMYHDWVWHQFLQDCKSGRIESVVKYIAKKLSFPVIFRIDGGYAEDPKIFDPYKSLLKDNDLYLLQWKQDSNKFVVSESRTKMKMLGELASVQTFADLNRFLDKMNNEKWLWLDFYIALKLRYKDLDLISDKEKDEWTAEMIWDRFLKHFLPWFK
jgi:hypothetical protein